LTVIAMFHFMLASLGLVLATAPVKVAFWQIGFGVLTALFLAAGAGLLRLMNWGRLLAIGLQFMMTPVWYIVFLLIAFMSYSRFLTPETQGQAPPAWLLLASLVTTMVVWWLLHGRIVSYLTSEAMYPLFMRDGADTATAVSPEADAPASESAYTGPAEE
jgi:hypothetical protein